MHSPHRLRCHSKSFYPDRSRIFRCPMVGSMAARLRDKDRSHFFCSWSRFLFPPSMGVITFVSPTNLLPRPPRSYTTQAGRLPPNGFTTRSTCSSVAPIVSPSYGFPKKHFIPVITPFLLVLPTDTLQPNSYARFLACPSLVRY